MALSIVRWSWLLSCLHKQSASCMDGATRWCKNEIINLIQIARGKGQQSARASNNLEKSEWKEANERDFSSRMVNINSAIIVTRQLKFYFLFVHRNSCYQCFALASQSPLERLKIQIEMKSEPEHQTCFWRLMKYSQMSRTSNKSHIKAITNR